MEFQRLKATLEKHQLWAKKSLGQHFLHDESICQRMVQHLQLKGQTVVEVGPGPGSLTDILLKEEPGLLLLIEKDQRFIEILKEFAPSPTTEFAIEPADALKVCISDLLKTHGKEAPYHIVANLPYNIGTELLVRWLDDIKNIGSITVMLQKEVVDRVKAGIGTKDYGRLSIIMQSCFEVHEMFQIPPEAFIPPPKVWSSVMYLKPKKELPEPKVLKTLEKLTATAFSQRRKMLRVTLGKALPLTLWQNLCTTLDIQETMRPEEIDAQTFLAMAKACITNSI
ncbi:MAG: 16S rRNA (adenine(1518)-N(6)/adenine(1519)-N(6))-dimethyltransferase RsmA [Pseudomonadota bacterium]|jgi:16S rRNA (adenine1518-N6/adenine1519-N6)-dimethyltransferase|nr:16S rRNA (adenine(1518)-N(6)/adenine(1519)-N(6))-dimethyltransferase RsmA [Alphaproteobacteria bacterium]